MVHCDSNRDVKPHNIDRDDHNDSYSCSMGNIMSYICSHCGGEIMTMFDIWFHKCKPKKEVEDQYYK